MPASLADSQASEGYEMRSNEMTSRERVGKALRHGRPDRVPIHEAFWEATANRWREEGLPEEMSPDDHFGTEIRNISVDNSFGFEWQEVERTEECGVVRDEWGILKRDWVDHRSTPELLDFFVKSRVEWDRVKGRLKPDPSRVDWDGVRAEHGRWREERKFVCLSAVPG